MNNIKIKPIKSNKLKSSANGQDCTINIAGVCQYEAAQCLCHFPDESHGTAKKSDDISAGFGCAKCHDVIDRRNNFELSDEDREFYMRRSQTRTLRIWLEMGLMKLT